MPNKNEDSVLDWDDLTPEDQVKAEALMRELNALFNKYTKEEKKPCDDSSLPE